MKVFCAKFNRAESALDTLIKRLEQKNMSATDYDKADYFLLSGDRCEMFDFSIQCLRDNKKIIHLWSGELGDWIAFDECYRTFITLSSMMQLCTNEKAKQRTDAICKSSGKISNAHVVGNVMLDDLSYDTSICPKDDYILVLYNPLTMVSIKEAKKDFDDAVRKVMDKHKKGYKIIWLEPNGDANSDLVEPLVTHRDVPRKQFLGLMKNCKYFITNSSCQFYESPSFLKPEQIIPIGKRNIDRESKKADMTITGATDKIIKLLEELD